MKILTVCCFYPPYEPNGGASIHAHDITKAYQKAGHTVAVFAGKLDTKNILHTTTKEVHDGVDVTRIILDYNSYSQPVKRIKGTPKILTEFQKMISTFKPDLIHFHSIQGLGADIVAYAISNKILTAVTCHDSWWICPRQFFLKSDKKTYCQKKSFTDCSLCHACLEGRDGITQRLRKEAEILTRDKYLYQIFNQIDYIIFPSKFIRNIYSRYFYKKNWLTSQNGIPTYKTKNAHKPKKKISFLFVGGGSSEKGAHLLVNTWQKFFSNNNKIELNIYGSSSQYLHSKVTASNIKIHGIYNREQLPEIFSNNNVLIYPSIIPENSPVTIKEAFAFGLPVIGSNVGGIPELIENNTNGFIFHNNDEIDLKIQIENIASYTTLERLKEGALKSTKFIDKQAQEILDFISSDKATTSDNKIGPTPLSGLYDIFYTKLSNNNDNRIFKASLFHSGPSSKIILRPLIFNLDASRKYIFTKFIASIDTKDAIEVSRSKHDLSNAEKQVTLSGNKIANWIEIYKLIKNNNISTVILPLPQLSHLRTFNRYLFILLGIRKFIFLDSKIQTYTLKFKFEINRQKGFKKNLILIKQFIVKLQLYLILLVPYVYFSLKGLVATKYGHSRVKSRILQLESSLTARRIIIDLILLPLKIIRSANNVILYNYLIK